MLLPLPLACVRLNSRGRLSIDCLPETHIFLGPETTVPAFAGTVFITSRQKRSYFFLETLRVFFAVFFTALFAFFAFLAFLAMLPSSV